MDKRTKDTLILIAVGAFVALPDLFPFFGDLIDAGVVTIALNYFRSQAALMYPDHRFDNWPREDRYGGRRHDGHYPPPSRHDDPIDVEWRRS